MAEKKEHWKAKEKRLRLEAEAAAKAETTPVETEVEEDIVPPVKKTKGKKEWTVSVGDKVINTYNLEDNKDAEDRATRLAKKLGGTIS